jgi:PKD repeat protein
MWNASGSYTWSAPANVNILSQYVIVGAGAPGGASYVGQNGGGGGGGGEVINGTNLPISSIISIKVGSTSSASNISMITARPGNAGYPSDSSYGGKGGSSGNGHSGGGYVGPGEYQTGSGGGGNSANGNYAGNGGAGTPTSIVNGESHTYGRGGNGAPYNVGYGYSGEGNEGLATGLVIIKYSNEVPPISSFTPSSVVTGISPVTVTFNDTSTNTPTYGNYTYQGYGSNTTLGYNFSTSLNTTATFTDGNFSISHGAGNAAGFNLSTQATWINVTPSATIPIAISSLSRAAMQAGSYLWYNDTSLNTPTSWNWTFGDGTYSSVTNGSKTYYRRGIYNVSSTVSNSAGSNTSYNIIRVV